MNEQLTNAKSSDIVSGNIFHSELNREIFLTPRRVHSFDKETLFNALYEVITHF